MMRHLRLSAWFVVWMCLLGGSIAWGQGQNVQTWEGQWTDAARNRTLPVMIYYPRVNKQAAAEHPPEPWPLIVFSHGLGGTCKHYKYLGSYWASLGYIVVHVQHPGSDDAVWRGKSNRMLALRAAAMDIGNIVNRPKDVTFAIDEMLRQNDQPDSSFHQRVDGDHIGVAGHSFGAYTTLAIGGQSFSLPRGMKISFGDARVKAIVPMSAPVPAGRVDLAESYATVRVPMLLMTGTDDQSPIGHTTPADRRIPYDKVSHADAYFLNLTDGDHSVFSAPNWPGRNKQRDAEHRKLILQSSSAFWNAYLKGDDNARQWLTDQDGMQKAAASAATFEVKTVETKGAKQQAGR